MLAMGCCGAAHPLLRLFFFFLLLLLPLSVAQERWPRQQRHDTVGFTKDVRCLNNYGSQVRRVSCVWQHLNQSIGEGPFYLNFSDLFGSLLCPLSASPEAGGHYSCTAEGDGEFTEHDEYRVSLHTAQVAYSVFPKYEPRLHIQCDAPTDLQSQVSASKCRIQWEKADAYEDFFPGDWHWQLEFKAAGEPWEQAENKSFIHQESWVDIDGSEFKHGQGYVARIRCKIPDENTIYRSHWSPWSATTHWTAPPGDGQKQLDPRLLRALLASLPLCLGVLLFLLLALRFAWRMDKGGSHIPTPAAFFQPLYASHNGDFKGWAGLTGKAVCLSSDTEEEENVALGSSQGGKGHAAAVPSSRITFLTPLEGGCCLDKHTPSGHPTGVKHVALGAVQTQGLQSGGRQGKELLLLPWGASHWEPGDLAGPEVKGAPLSLPSFLEPGPCRETEALFSCSNDYYCMWGGGSSSGPGTLMYVLAGEPRGAEDGCRPGAAPAQCAPGEA